MEKSTKARKIPESDSIEELARFWDTLLPGSPLF